jgi:hypothetical protein
LDSVCHLSLLSSPFKAYRVKGLKSLIQLSNEL